MIPAAPTPPAELVDYFTTHHTPEGMSWQELLAKHADYMNDTGLPAPEYREASVAVVDGWNLRIAIWGEQTPPTTRPCVYYIHGGAWAAGNHTGFPGIAAVLVDAGYLVVSVDYRRAPRHHFPAAFHDCQRVLQWCSTQIGRYGGDPDNIAVLGDSAGANLAAAVLAADATHSAKAGVLLFGIYDYHLARPVMGSLGLPVNYVDPDDLDQFIGDARLNPVRAAQRLPPCLILVGETDWALAQSRLLRDALVAHRVEHQYAEIPDTPHGFTLLPGHHGYGSSWRKVLEFLDHKIGP